MPGAAAEIILVRIGRRMFTVADAITAAAVLAEARDGEHEVAYKLAVIFGLDDLTPAQLEALCAAFSVEVT